MPLPDYVVLDPAIEYLARGELDRLQLDRLQAQVRYCSEEIPFWRSKLDTARVRPEDIRSLDDLRRLPFTTRHELEVDQAAHSPLGTYVGAPRERWARFFTTTGTTGRPLRRVFSGRDWEYVLQRYQRAPSVRPGDIVFVCGPVDGLMGPTAGAEFLARQGALVVLGGLFDTARRVELIRELRPTVLSGTPSYLLHLAEAAAERGVDTATLGVRALRVFGEPGANIPGTREELARRWGGPFVRDGYGLTELFPLGGSCRDSADLHIADDVVLTEVIDPRTGDPRPPGEPGELVYTNLIGDSQPLLRYRTGDIGRLRPSDEPCACGSSFTRIVAIEGRVDDMIWHHGVNVFPSAIERAVRSVPELSGEFQVVVDQQGARQRLLVRVEAQAVSGSEGALLQRLVQALRETIRVNADVELAPYGSLPRGPGKTQRVVRRS